MKVENVYHSTNWKRKKEMLNGCVWKQIPGNNNINNIIRIISTWTKILSLINH